MRARRTPVLVDVVLALGLTVLSVVTLAGAGGDAVGPFGVVLAILAVAPIALRQLAPVLTMAVIAAALALYALLGYGDWPSAAIGLVVAMFTVATLRPRRVAAAAFPMAIGVLVVSVATSAGVTWALTIQALLVLACSWALGEATRRWARDAQDAAARAERAVADERTRLARELHDVVAHHMSVVTLQAGLASYVLAEDPAAARRAIDHADDAGREALRDMRRMLQALRTEDDPAPRTPQPDLARLDELVDRVRATGLTVDLQRHGDTSAVAPGPQLCAFRVVQESLTNVLKHAGSATTARVVVAVDGTVLTAEVADDGAGTPPGAAPRGGHGIRGMRERAALYDGVLEAGPAPSGGFRVGLRLPLAPRASSVATAGLEPS